MLNKLILLIFLISCQRESNFKLFENQGYLNLATTHKVLILRKKTINTGATINRPVATWWPLIEFKAIGSSGLSLKKYCLIYKIPAKKKGELKLVELNKAHCHEEILTDSRLTIKDVFDLKVYLTGRSIKIKDIPPFHLSLKFKKEGKDINLEFPLLNLSEDNIRVLGNYKLKKTTFNRNRFSVGLEQTLVPGAIFWPNLDGGNGDSFLQGHISDNFIERTSIACHRINNKCETIGSYTCDKCRYGWYETVPTKCPRAGDKFCGTLNCGGKGEPACYRGYAYKNVEVKFGCYKGNPAGFCRDGLSAICDAKGVLVCN
jgi:hypothetical protein